jgi:hypothetical protein
MTFLDRMRSDTGSPYPVWLYLVDKIAHTALGAWVLVSVFGLPMGYSAVVSALSYLALGKLLWLRGNTEPIDLMGEWRDCTFDGVLGLGVALLTVIASFGWRSFAFAFASWGFLLLAGGNNRWGKPG